MSKFIPEQLEEIRQEKLSKNLGHLSYADISKYMNKLVIKTAFSRLKDLDTKYTLKSKTKTQYEKLLIDLITYDVRFMGFAPLSVLVSSLHIRKSDIMALSDADFYAMLKDMRVKGILSDDDFLVKHGDKIDASLVARGDLPLITRDERSYYRT